MNLGQAIKILSNLINFIAKNYSKEMRAALDSTIGDIEDAKQYT